MKLYQSMAYGENMSWCKPIEYTHKNLRVIMVYNEGEILSVAFWRSERRSHPNAEKEICEKVERETAEQYVADWLGVDDIDEAYCKELGCCECPWRTTCEAMYVE